MHAYDINMFYIERIIIKKIINPQDIILMQEGSIDF